MGGEGVFFVNRGQNFNYSNVLQTTLKIKDKKESRYSQTRLNCTVDEPNHTRQGPKRDRLSAERSEKSICKMDSELWHRARNTGKDTVTVIKKEIHYFLDRLLDEQDQIGKLYIVSEERPIIACGKSVNSTHSPPTNVIFEELILMLLFRLSCHVMLRLTYVQNNLCILYLISEINRILVATKC